MNEEMKDILLVALGGAALFGGLYLACLASEKYRKWQRKKDEEEYEAWREKRRKAREAREAERAAKTNKEPTKPEATEVPARMEAERADDDAREGVSVYLQRTRLALAYEYAGRAKAVYHEGRGLVEAYFYAQLAKLNGHRQIQSLISQIRVSWRQMGYPDEKQLLHDDFGAIESAMGRACLRIDSRHEAELGEVSLTELAEGGNEMAKALLEARN